MRIKAYGLHTAAARILFDFYTLVSYVKKIAEESSSCSLEPLTNFSL